MPSRAALGRLNATAAAALLAAPQVALTMSAADAVPVFLILLLLWVSLALKAWLRLLRAPGARVQLAHVAAHLAEPRKRFVSTFRGATTFMTVLGILAVDFAAFPRRYAKAERHGQGLMDAGVGAVVFAGGLVSKAALAGAGGRGGGGGGGGGAAPRALAGLRAVAPLLALGGARLLATRAVGYQQHVGEYGVHWNFFLTVAAVGLLTLAARVPPRLLLPAGLLAGAAHQAALSLGGLGGWVQSEARGPGWVSLNKEGVGSVAGYWAIHLLGAAAGKHLRGSCAATAARVRAPLAAPHKRGGSGPASGGGGAGAGPGGGGAPLFGGGGGAGGGVSAASQEVWSWVARLVIVDVAAWAAAAAVEVWVEPVSRRACNLAYVLWVCAQCGAGLIMCLITDIAACALSAAAAPRHVPPPPAAAAAAAAGGGGASQLLEAFNRNMLGLFLAANLVTGAVNLGMDTMAAGDGAARAVVGAYLGGVCLLALALDAANITLKL
ncbi:MAG: GWT1-domain-containing protein [Monoraphidium minutum]|nr:MAG: GWT1-domain-containing protein [Monoraphidium minutum]